MLMTAEDPESWDNNLYVITLATSSRPMRLSVPFVHELVGFSVFRSKTSEDGRERYRLHLGYFASAARAHEALAVVRRYFPTAWISAAPRSSLGSLDDTLNADFQPVRRGQARVVKAEDVALSAETPADAGAATERQRYVVQLDWSLEPNSWLDIPRLAVFRAYHLYRVKTQREGGAEHALRLGFFQSIDAAHQVAEHVRAHFPRVSVVPASMREFVRALELMRRRAEEAEGGTTSAPDAQPLAGESDPALPPTAAASHDAPHERTREELLALLGADRLEVDGDESAGLPRAGRKPDRRPR
jgi:hypothetical protein